VNPSPGSCSINLINGGVTVEGSNAVIEFSGSRDITGLTCTLDSGVPNSSCRSPLRFNGLSSGTHKLAVRPQGCENASEESVLSITFEI